jgi:hypothetical protein
VEPQEVLLTAAEAEEEKLPTIGHFSLPENMHSRLSGRAKFAPAGAKEHMKTAEADAEREELHD